MKYISILLLSVLCFSCGVSHTDKQDHVMVDARVRVYHKDGSRSYNEYKPFETRTVELLQDYKAPKKEEPLSKYGGDLRKQYEATGFFHVKKDGDRWTCVDPLGYKYINVALNGVVAKGSKGTMQAFKELYGTKEQWIKETTSLLYDHGFNCAGSWSDHKTIIAFNETAENPLPYTIILNFMSSYGRKLKRTHQQAGHTGYPNDAIFVFNPDFEQFCDKHAKKLLTYKDDANLFGYFSDNEMPFKKKALNNYLALPEGDYGRLAAEAWLVEQGITKDEITETHRLAFMALVGEKYFSTINDAIKRYDPNHLFLGSRFYSSEKHTEPFMRAVADHLDVISNNYYNRWTPDSLELAEWAEWTDKPFLITEYYTKGEDSGMGNKSGAGWIVRTQKDRGLFYQNYNLALLESKNCVGWHYFKYQDNDPTAKGVDPSNLDANKGIVSNRFVPWTPLLDQMKELNTQKYALQTYFDKQ